jgi:hypothetical protein
LLVELLLNQPQRTVLEEAVVLVVLETMELLQVAVMVA